MKTSEKVLLGRFLNKIEVAANGCWIWTGTRFNNGYGRAYFNGTSGGAHRVIYELLIGPVDPKLTLDHMCHNRDQNCTSWKDCPHRACVNPAHLELATTRVNIIRGHGSAAKKARQTICKRGHPLSGENLVVRDGRRQCRKCERIRQRVRNKTEKRQASEKRFAQSEKRKVYVKKWNEENADRTADYQRTYRERHRDEILAKAHTEERRAKQREYQRRYREKKMAERNAT